MLKNSSHKTVSDKIQYICNVILALGAIAAVITGITSWRRQGTLQPSIAIPTAPAPPATASSVTVDNSNQINNSSEGGKATAETAPIDIDVQSRSEASPSTTFEPVLQITTPPVTPVEAVSATSDVQPVKLADAQSSPTQFADQPRPTQVQPQSENGVPKAVTNTQTMTASPGGVQVQGSPGATVTTGGTTVTETNTTNNNAPACVGGIGNACASDSTVNNNLNGATIDNRATMP